MHAPLFVTLVALSAQPAQDPQKVANIIPFDIASCFPPKATPAANPEGVSGALRLLRPHVIECLADGKLRAGDVTVTVATGEAGLTVTGADGAAKACIEKAASGLTLPAGVKASAEFRVGGVPVKLGINAASDIAAAIRLGQAQWCDCYASKVASVQELEVRAKAGAATEVKGASGCLADKVKALKFSPPNETRLPYTFFFIDSRNDAEAADAPPELAFQNLDAIRARRSAESAMAVGNRIVAVVTYDDLVKTYNAKKKPFKMLKELIEKCQEIVKADDALIAAFTTGSDLDKHTAELADGWAAKNPQWKPAADAMRAQSAAGADEVKKTQAARDADAKGCPK